MVFRKFLRGRSSGHTSASASNTQNLETPIAPIQSPLATTAGHTSPAEDPTPNSPTVADHPLGTHYLNDWKCTTYRVRFQ